MLTDSARADSHMHVRNALTRVLLAGVTHADRQAAALAALERAQDCFVCIAFASGAESQVGRFVSVLGLRAAEGPAHRLWGGGPRVVQVRDMLAFFKFDTASRAFQRVNTHALTPTVHGVGIMVGPTASSASGTTLTVQQSAEGVDKALSISSASASADEGEGSDLETSSQEGLEGLLL